MFKYVDAPPLPQHLVDIVRTVVAGYQGDTKLPEFQKMQINDEIVKQIELIHGTPEEGLGVSFDTAYTYKGLATFTMIKLEGPVLDWIKENVCAEIDGLHIQLIEGEYVFPHVDMLRSRVWNYTIDTGDAVTCFYKAKPEYAHLPVVPRTYVPYERVDKIDTIKIDAHRWHELSVCDIHGVEEIKAPRLALSISFIV